MTFKGLRSHFSDKEILLGQSARTSLDSVQIALQKWHIDGQLKVRMGGIKGKHSLYRSLSCNSYLPNITTPTFVITASDDPIAQGKNVPIEDLKRNSNILHANYDRGGHANFFMKEIDEETNRDVHAPYVTKLAMQYFDEVDNYLILK